MIGTELGSYRIQSGTEVKVVMTEGSSQFGAGDRCRFTVFKTTRQDATKTSEIEEGSIDVTEGP